jgi:hypothetical protein
MIGNDVVDLTEAAVEASHPRFDERVFSPAERAVIAAAPAPARCRWRLWAAKEAAFKIARKRDPHAVFSPLQFEVGPSAVLRTTRRRVEPPPYHGATVGRGFHPPPGDAEHRRGVFTLWFDDGDDYVHVLATDDADSMLVVSAVAPAEGDPSAAVRALAIDVIARVLGEAPQNLGIVISPDRIPRLCRPGGSALDLSLSHHGRHVAFACDLRDAA